jgi:hypothetical protein
MGHVPMMAAHPASAGHGLNLQWGSNILVDYTSGWDLEYDDQIIERIGPMRQYQAGLNRPVYGIGSWPIAPRTTSSRSAADEALSAGRSYSKR